jgi:hypothetical protein
LQGRDQRAHLGGRVEGISDDDRLRAGLGDRFDLGEFGAWNDHARQRNTGLARIHEDLAQTSTHRLDQVGVVEDYQRRFATQLQPHPLDGLGGDRSDPASGSGGTGERHLVDVPMGDQCLTDLRAGSGEEVEHPRRIDNLERISPESHGAIAALKQLSISFAEGPPGATDTGP